MKTIGILGGMSAASTLLYYEELVRLTRVHLGGLHSPELLIRSLDFAPIAQFQAQNDWQSQGAVLNNAAKALVAGGAELIVLATNTMHKVADAMMHSINLPLVHIADATADAIQAAGLKRPGLLATAFTMEQDFYRRRLQGVGIDPLIPSAADRAEAHRIIYEELCKGIVTDASRTAYEAIVVRLKDAGADCLILGCTEVGLLLSADNVPMPVFDTTLVHCAAALEAALI